MLSVVVVAALLTGCGASEPAPDGPLTGADLVAALGDGGLVLYLRHTDTTEGGVDDVSSLGDCSRQRELSEAGRRDAREIGRAFDDLGIPVGRVVASPFCRTVDTAELAFGRTETDEGLLALPSTSDPAEAARLEQRGRRLIGTEPAEGTNVVLVGHISNVNPITGASPDEGGTVVFRPDGDGRFLLVGEVPPQGWPRLAERF